MPKVSKSPELVALALPPVVKPEKLSVRSVAPVSALISDDGRRVVTFDNWYSLGFGKNVVVIYGATGEPVRSLELLDMMPAYFLDGLPRSVSSMQWHGAEPTLHGGLLEIPVSDPDIDRKIPAFVISVSLEDGAVHPAPAETMNSVRPRFCAAHSREVQSENANNAFNRSDLVAPVDRPRKEWDRYQYQAVIRSMPPGQLDEVDATYSTFELLLPGEYMAKDFRETFRARLTAEKSELPLRWLTSRNLELMTVEVERTARKIRPGQLAGVEIRFLADKAHWPRLQAALSQSGAKLVLVDINTPIPQRPEVLARLPADRVINPDCRP